MRWVDRRWSDISFAYYSILEGLGVELVRLSEDTYFDGHFLPQDRVYAH